MIKANDVRNELLSLSGAEQREKSEYFFKTGYGSYSAHDEFIGVRMPDIRRVAKDYSTLPLPEVKKLLYSKVHEDRLCSLIILVLAVKKALKDQDKTTIEKIAQFYLLHKAQVNNWDLVDASAHYILGQYILLYPEKAEILYELARSQNLWDRRIAMVSQWLLIRQDHYDHVLPLATILLHDEEDLIRKAVGWMLRELWKKQSDAVDDFLRENYSQIPRTTLRYAIEKYPQDRRKAILRGHFQ